VRAFWQLHPDRNLVRLAELLNDRLAEAKRANLFAQLGDRRLRGFLVGDANHLAADEIDAEIEPAREHQRERGRYQQQADRVERHAPAQEVDVGVVGDQLEQFHGGSLTAGYRWAASCAASSPPTAGSASPRYRPRWRCR